MGMKLEAGDYGRIDVQTIAPEHIIHTDDKNSRVDPHTEEDIKKLAESIVANGQIQPCLGRRIKPSNQVEAVAGFGRIKAIEYANKFLCPDKPLKVLIRVMEMSAEEAFLRSLEENLQRKDCSPLDHAHAARKLKDVYNWTDSRIAEYFGKSISYVATMRKVTTLDTEIQEKVKDGSLPITTAALLVEVAEEERKEVIDTATKADGKVDATEVKRTIAKKNEQKNPQADSDSTKRPARSLKEIREYFDLVATDEDINPNVKALAKSILKFISANPITEIAMGKALAKYVKEAPKEVAAGV